MENYILVWIDEEEKWYYFKEKFNENKFKDGYVAYDVHVKNGVIVSDDLKVDNVGNKFVDCYDKSLWK